MGIRIFTAGEFYYPTAYVNTPLSSNGKLVACCVVFGDTTSGPNITRVYYDDGGAGVNFTEDVSIGISYITETTRYARLAIWHLDAADFPKGQQIEVKALWTGGGTTTRKIACYAIEDAKQGAVDDTESISSGSGTTVSRTLYPVETNSVHLAISFAAYGASFSLSGYLGLTEDDEGSLASDHYVRTSIGYEYRTTSASDTTGFQATVSTTRFAMVAVNVGEDVADPEGAPRFFPNLC